jgi:mannose-1-phosphate guanylyltransferase / mannose-6-phosphate isomerase
MLIPVILCGGAGSRLWPVSRQLYPKPFMRLEDGQSLLQKAFLRGALLPGVDEVLTISNRELFFATEDEYRKVAPAGMTLSFLLEPFGRNTAAAVAAAALQVQRVHGDSAVMLVLPADHLISDQDAFAAAVGRAVMLAEQGKIVTFGIKPEHPETGYGYIEFDGAEVKRFVEKPDVETAKAYVSGGKHLWNSGMFCFSAGVMLDEMQKLCPEILQSVRMCLEKSRSRKLCKSARRLDRLRGDGDDLGDRRRALQHRLERHRFLGSLERAGGARRARQPGAGRGGHARNA